MLKKTAAILAYTQQRIIVQKMGKIIEFYLICARECRPSIIYEALLLKGRNGINLMDISACSHT